MINVKLPTREEGDQMFEEVKEQRDFLFFECVSFIEKSLRVWCKGALYTKEGVDITPPEIDRVFDELNINKKTQELVFEHAMPLVYDIFANLRDNLASVVAGQTAPEDPSKLH